MVNESEQCVVFITYSSKDEFQVLQLAADLRKQEIQILAYPYDLPGAANIDDGIKAHTRNKILAIALSPNSATSSWMKQRMERTVLEPFADTLRGVYLLTLARVPKKDTSALSYHDRYESIDLSGEAYASGVQTLIARVGAAASVAQAAPAAEVGVPAPFTMTGVFQPGRPATELFAELKREVYGQDAIDQKYLYWDVRAVLRWQRIAELSGYMTVQMGMNLFAARGGDIVDAIVSDLNRDEVTFVNLGVGTGVKDYLILSQLLQRVDRVIYFAVDESFPMIQLTMQTLEELLSASRGALSAHYIVDDLRNLNRHKEFLEEADPLKAPRIFGFDNMLANFKEPLLVSVIRESMRPCDYLLLGVEYVADRTDEALIRNYADRRMKEFLYGPISDATGSQPNWGEDFRYDIAIGGPYQKYSEVPGSKVVVGKVKLNGKIIELFFSTKFEPEPLEHYLEQEKGFKILASFKGQEDTPRYGVYVLKLG